MESRLASPYVVTQDRQQSLFRLATGALCLGIAAALFLTLVWFVSPLTDYPDEFRHTGDYLFTGNGVPFAIAPLVLLWTLHALHGDRGGRKVTVGIGLATVSLVVLMVQLAASVAASQELQWGPSYPLATLGSIVGIALCCAGWARIGFLPRTALWFWALSWAVGGMLGPKGSQLLLAAGYAVLLVQLRKRARQDSNLRPSVP